MEGDTEELGTGATWDRNSAQDWSGDSAASELL